MNIETDERQQQFADRLVDVLTRAAEVLGPEATFEAAIGAACGWATTHAPGPAIAEHLRLLAAEMQSHRRRESHHPH